MNFLKSFFPILVALTLLMNNSLNASSHEPLPVYCFSDVDQGNPNRFNKIQKFLQNAGTIPPLTIQAFSLHKQGEELPDEGLQSRIKRLDQQIQEKIGKKPCIFYAAGDDGFVLSKYLEECDNHTIFAAILVNGMLGGCFGAPSKKTHKNPVSQKIVQTFIEKAAEQVYQKSLNCCLSQLKKIQEEKAQKSTGFTWFTAKTKSLAVSGTSAFFNIIPKSFTNSTPESLLNYATSMFYTPEMQSSSLAAALWHDPNNVNYRPVSLLAHYNNEGEKIEKRFEKNLARLAYLKLIASPDDQFSKPWWSSLFLKNEPKDLSDLETAFKNDYQSSDPLGLTDLLSSKKISLKVIPSGHECHENKKVAKVIAQSIIRAELLWRDKQKNKLTILLK